MEITIENRQKKVLLSPAQIQKIVKKILRHEGVAKASLSVVFVSAQKIRALNLQFLSRPHTTDVLAFNFNDWGSTSPPKGFPLSGKLSGEIIISTDAARQYARRLQACLAQELTLYVIHGCLHLLGYDDHAPEDVRQMRTKEAELLALCAQDVAGVLDP